MLFSSLNDLSGLAEATRVAFALRLVTRSATLVPRRAGAALAKGWNLRLPWRWCWLPRGGDAGLQVWIPIQVWMV